MKMMSDHPSLENVQHPLDMLEQYVNKGELVCPLCDDHSHTGAGGGLIFCSKCNFRSCMSLQFKPNKCPQWIKDLTSVHHFAWLIPRESPKRLLYFPFGSTMVFKEKIGEVEQGKYIVVATSHGLSDCFRNPCGKWGCQHYYITPKLEDVDYSLPKKPERKSSFLKRLLKRVI